VLAYFISTYMKFVDWCCQLDLLVIYTYMKDWTNNVIFVGKRLNRA